MVLPLSNFPTWSLIVMLLLGFIALGYGGELLTRGSVGISVNLNIDPLVVGLTVVSIATSMPEFSTTLMAAREFPGLAMGNILGSNIANSALILGVAALLVPLKVKLSLIEREVPILIGITLIFTVLFYLGNGLSRGDGYILVALTFVYLIFIVRTAHMEQQVTDSKMGQGLAEQTGGISLMQAFGLVVLGGVLLALGADGMVQSSVELASRLGVSDVFIGLTLVALGTSLPELAASIAAVRAGQGDLCVGNILGSNLFNLLLVGGGSAAYASLPVDGGLLNFEFIALFVATALLYFFIRSGQSVTRREGVILLSMYFLFVSFAALKQLGLIL
jgi:cation:H+ antiporter